MKKYIKDGEIKLQRQIVIVKDDMCTYNPTEEMILADGWEEYVTPEVEDVTVDPIDPISIITGKSEYEIVQELVTEQYNARTDIEDNEALERSIVIWKWDKYIGKPLKSGQVVVYNGNVYRVRQDINEVLSIYPPSIDTAALYGVIEMVHTGELDDPIPYVLPMEIFESKYYIENNVIYLCIRDSQQELAHSLSDLIGLYVEKVD